jgi:hypothetical protein
VRAVPDPFSYAILRLVPRVERGESINVGVVLFCRQRGEYLGLLSEVDEPRLRPLAPDLDAEAVRGQLRSLELVALGDRSAGSLGALPPSERFGWLVAPSSTIVQPSDVHTGLCEDPGRELRGLFDKLVRPPGYRGRQPGRVS